MQRRTMRLVLLGCSMTFLAGCGGDDAAAPPGDSIPPAAVSDLILVEDKLSLTLSWTAPGDDGTYGTADQYDTRYLDETITEANWGSATQLLDEPIPSIAGTGESLVVDNLADAGTYYFALKTADEANNWSSLSNVASRFPDTTPPAVVYDLVTLYYTDSSVTLRWTAPGDDGASGKATQYDIRYSSFPLNASTFGTASQVMDIFPPRDPGSTDQAIVNGLSMGMQYYFALRTADEVPNWSGISNAPTATTRQMTQITFDPGQDDNPTWSPDGLNIAFHSTRGGEGNIWIMPVAGGPATQLTLGPAADGEPDWSPDGSMIAFSSNRDGGGFDFHIWVVSVSSGVTTQLTFGPYYDHDPAWSPNGNLIAFHSNRDGHGYDIFTVPVTGGSVTQITQGGNTEPTPDWNRFPTWSPNGSQIACTDGGHIYTVPSGGGARTQLTLVVFNASSCDWSPVMDIVAFQKFYLISGQTGDYDISVYSIATGESYSIRSRGNYLVGPQPNWSPDGSMIAFVSHESGNDDIWIMNTDDLFTK